MLFSIGLRNIKVMIPTASLNKTNNAPYGFVLGVIGGMAAYYLTESAPGRHLRQRLVAIYDTAKIESGQWLQEYLTVSPPPTPPPVLAKPSWFVRFRQLLNPHPKTLPEKPKRFFQKTSKKKR
jgi:hypothetical protein